MRLPIRCGVFASLLFVLAGPAFADSSADPVAAAEAARYGGRFAEASALLDKALAATPKGQPAEQLRLRLQQMRVQQTQRLADAPAPDEAAVRAAAKALAARVSDPQLKALHVLRETTSDYFVRLTDGPLGDVEKYAPAFRAAAAGLSAPCDKANALFFGALMKQMAGKVAESAAPLAAAERVAKDGGCTLELSYVTRHQAGIHEEAKQWAQAEALYRTSLEQRRQIGFTVYAPYSLLSLADAEAAQGKHRAADAHRHEAAAMAGRLHLRAAALESHLALLAQAQAAKDAAQACTHYGHAMAIAGQLPGTAARKRVEEARHGVCPAPATAG